MEGAPMKSALVNGQPVAEGPNLSEVSAYSGSEGRGHGWRRTMVCVFVFM